SSSPHPPVNTAPIPRSTYQPGASNLPRQFDGRPPQFTGSSPGVPTRSPVVNNAMSRPSLYTPSQYIPSASRFDPPLPPRRYVPRSLPGVSQAPSIPRVTTPRPTTATRPRGAGGPPLSSLQSADPLLLCELGMLPCEPGYPGPQPPEPPFLGGQMPGVRYTITYGLSIANDFNETNCSPSTGSTSATGPIRAIEPANPRTANPRSCLYQLFGTLRITVNAGTTSSQAGVRRAFTGQFSVARTDGAPDTGGNPPPLPGALPRRGINPNGPGARHRRPVNPPTLRLVPESPQPQAPPATHPPASDPLSPSALSQPSAKLLKPAKAPRPNQPTATANTPTNSRPNSDPCPVADSDPCPVATPDPCPGSSCCKCARNSNSWYSGSNS
ncbi:MAG: hypothetical protein HC899_40170, partial [Leptolyngbyaceae cyanobacterium SM1_4_3]|nr:hypothetical protein [Leptolyngbyaceae cyanobacterium SM1_4_3]